MDAAGAEVARRFTEAAGVTFPSAVDRAQGLWALYGFDVVPNGFLVDERGILRYIKIGGFEVRDPEDARAIEQLIAAPTAEEPAAQPAGFGTVAQALQQAEAAARRDPESLDLQLDLAERRLEAKQADAARSEFEAVLKQRPQSTRALVGLATADLDLGHREKALEALRQARALEPNNWIIRKQVWSIEHPEQFYPAINTRWQEEQIKKEDAARK